MMVRSSQPHKNSTPKSTKELVAAFLTNCNSRSLSKERVQCYRNFLSVFAEEYPRLPLNPHVIQAFVGGFHPNDERRRGCYSTLRAFYDFLERHFGLPTNPVRNTAVSNPDTEEGPDMSCFEGGNPVLDRVNTGGTCKPTDYLKTLVSNSYDEITQLIRSRPDLDDLHTIAEAKFYFHAFLSNMAGFALALMKEMAKRGTLVEFNLQSATDRVLDSIDPDRPMPATDDLVEATREAAREIWLAQVPLYEALKAEHYAKACQLQEMFPSAPDIRDVAFFTPEQFEHMFIEDSGRTTRKDRI